MARNAPVVADGQRRGIGKENAFTLSLEQREQSGQRRRAAGEEYDAAG